MIKNKISKYPETVSSNVKQNAEKILRLIEVNF